MADLAGKAHSAAGDQTCIIVLTRTLVMLKDLSVFITQLNFEFLENFQLQNDKTSLSYISQFFFLLLTVIAVILSLVLKRETKIHHVCDHYHVYIIYLF